ncbi:MAG: phosphopantetheine adenylyltransferase [Roseibium sp.]
MRHNETIERTAHQAVTQPFATKVRALDPMAHIKMASVFALALLTVLVTGIISMNTGNASQAQEMTNLAPKGMLTTKTNRAATAPIIDHCGKQAWGAWSEDCVTKLTGRANVRNVSFVTVEKATQTVNETILARYPTFN